MSVKTGVLIRLELMGAMSTAIFSAYTYLWIRVREKRKEKQEKESEEIKAGGWRGIGK